MRTHIFPLLTIFLLSLSSSSSSSSNLIKDTCKKCSDTDPNIRYNFCTSSFNSSPDSNQTTDLRQLGLVSIRLTKNNVTSTRHFIKHLLRDDKNKKMNNNNNTITNTTTKLDPYVKACLNDCMELYSDAVSTIKLAVKDYKAKRYDDANIGLSSVIDASTTCEDGFKENDNSKNKSKNHVVSPLTKRNDNAFQLTAISLSIINMLRN
ncbi:hypothetical protein G4B88_021894 [Cannabis sativa]|uniref:Pectinesterase inhibitor domain-containing protein n=1 Tax=Cannabis sativa TaxID=3483 RepID=A0A7J6GZT8_CANSA|nr:hypothetical protein G4B88_021894 [Cannabis sativa]